MNEEINLFEIIDKEYIQPELELRRKNNNLSDEFQVRECLIKLHGDSPPIISFNNEFRWEVKPTLAPNVTMNEGKPIYLHEVIDIGEVLPPTVNDQRVSFIYLFWNGKSYTIIVDPYHPVFMDHPFSTQEVIANHLRNHFKEVAIKNAQYIGSKLHDMGLWIAISLLPYPISKIVERIGEGSIDGATELLIAHCDSDFLTKKIVDTWHPITAFKRRSQFFDDALYCHKENRFHGSISILVGQIEGVITDWLYEIEYYDTDKKRSINTKFKDFRQALDDIPNLLWIYNESKDSMLRFLINKPLLQNFVKWNQNINSSFPGRHVVQHGKYNEDVFSQENSIKLFLLLDTICQFMMFYEARVLGRDIGQNKNSETQNT